MCPIVLDSDSCFISPILQAHACYLATVADHIETTNGPQVQQGWPLILAWIPIVLEGCMLQLKLRPALFIGKVRGKVMAISCWGGGGGLTDHAVVWDAPVYSSYGCFMALDWGRGWLD